MRSAFGQVMAVKDGRIERVELFEPEDDRAMLARLDELRAEHAARPIERMVAELLRTLNARDWERLRTLYAPSYRVVDRRPQGGDMDLDQLIAAYRNAAELMSNVRWTRRRVLGMTDDVYASVLELRGDIRGGGGPGAQAYGNVVVRRGDRFVHSELFEADDEPALLARFDELAVEHAPTPAERMAAEFVRRFNARDWDGIAALLADDVAFTHHLRMSLWRYETTGEWIAQMRDLVALAPDVRAHNETIAVEGDVLAGRQQWTGTFEGGPASVRAAYVAVIRDGRIARFEAFDADDEDALLARYEELRAEADAVQVSPAADPDAPAVALVRAQARAFNARDWNAYRALCREGYVAVDHRVLGWGHELELDRVIETAASSAALVPDMRMTTEVVAASGPLAAARVRVTGHDAQSGGALEISFRTVLVTDGERAERAELFAEEDRDAQLARFDELLVEHGRTTTTAAERRVQEYLRLFHARDHEGLLDLYTEDFTAVDRRRPALWEFAGREDAVDQLRLAWEQGITPRTRIELITTSPRGDVVALRQIFHRDDPEAPIET
ncbi:MAG TPA: nuclear transport factor 2 family protein, partial [Solirubrobacteraceae bacterium]|nr:nuclear transport factor 2 family protein [Solirubrobacteraceae bacterium]